MTKTESNHATAFIVFFSVIALAINSVQFHKIEQVRAVQQQVFQQEQQAQVDAEKQAEAQKAAQQAAAKHAQFVAQFVNSGFSKTPGMESFALVVATKDGKIDQNIGDTLAGYFKSGTVNISTSLFKPEFVSDKLFANLFGGSTELLKKLDLAHSLDGLLLASETVEYVKNPASLDNVLTANMTLEIHLMPIAGSIQSRAWKFTATGAGFSQTEALSNAEERLIKKMSNDSTMSLSN